MKGIERIKILASEIKDKALLKIIEYLTSREDMNDKYLNEEKTLKQMTEFIKGQAQKHSHDGMAMVEDEVVYGWAIHYFDETNDKLELSTKTTNEKTAKDTINKSNEENKTTKKNIDKSQKWVAEGQLTLF